MKIFNGEIPENPYPLPSEDREDDLITERKAFNTGQQSILSQLVEVNLNKLGAIWLDEWLNEGVQVKFEDYLKQQLGVKE